MTIDPDKAAAAADRATKLEELEDLNCELATLKHTIIEEQHAASKMSWMCIMLMKLEKIANRQHELLTLINEAIVPEPEPEPEV